MPMTIEPKPCVSSPSLPGDPGLALIQGTSYELFLRPVTDGTLTISGIDNFFQTFCIGIAGIQLERQLPSVPSLSPIALAGLTLLLVGATLRRQIVSRSQ